MQSRSRILIERQYNVLLDSNLWGVEAHPVSLDDFYSWYISLKGEIGTVWEGGTFLLYMKFDEYYNDRPPQIFFHTIPFHPNVIPATGLIALDFLCQKDKWKTSYDLVYILLSVQAMLASPQLDNVVNAEAADLLQKDPGQYNAIVKKCVRASIKVSLQQTHLSDDNNKNLRQLLQAKQDRALNMEDLRMTSIHLNSSSKISTNSSLSFEGPVVSRIAFEDYYQLWSQIATSKSGLHANAKLGAEIRAPDVKTHLIREPHNTPYDRLVADNKTLPDEDEVNELLQWSKHLDTDVV